MPNPESAHSSYCIDVEVDGETVESINLAQDAIRAWCAMAMRNEQSLEVVLHQSLINTDRIERAVADDGQLLLKRGRTISEITWVPEP